MIRKATVEDVKEIQRLINYYAKREKMLPRSLNELYESIRNFFVYCEGRKIYGCCALNIDWEDLAEIKSLAVAKSKAGKGIGSKLLEECLIEYIVNKGVKTGVRLTRRGVLFCDIVSSAFL